MSNIKEVLQKQADAVKANFESLKKAEQLEAQAAAIRVKASKPVIADFKAIARAKQANIERFAEAIKTGKQRDMEATLKQNNWVLAMKSKDEARYGLKEAPGYSLRVKGGKFSLNYHDEVKQPAMDIAYLATYLSKFKKQLK